MRQSAGIISLRWLRTPSRTSNSVRPRALDRAAVDELLGQIMRV